LAENSNNRAVAGKRKKTLQGPNAINAASMDIFEIDLASERVLDKAKLQWSEPREGEKK